MAEYGKIPGLRGHRMLLLNFVIQYQTSIYKPISLSHTMGLYNLAIAPWIAMFKYSRTNENMALDFLPALLDRRFLGELDATRCKGQSISQLRFVRFAFSLVKYWLSSIVTIGYTMGFQR